VPLGTSVKELSMTHPLAVVRGVLAWPVGSQEHARRNAMVACTALAERRRDRLETEEFLRRHARRRPTAAALRDVPLAPEGRADVI
jgi:hypothetical protein